MCHMTHINIRELEPYQLVRSPFRKKRPLQYPNPSELEHIRQSGFVKPLLARPLGEPESDTYEILIGEMAWLAAQSLNLIRLPTVIKSFDDEQARVIVEQDDFSRVDPITQAQLLKAMVNKGRSITAVGQAHGMTRTVASHLMRLLRLAPSVQLMVQQFELSVGQAKPLVTLPVEIQHQLALCIVNDNLPAQQIESIAQYYRDTGKLDESPTSAPLTNSNPDLQELETALAQYLGSGVTIQVDGSGSGQLIIQYSDLDVFDGLLDKIGFTKA